MNKIIKFRMKDNEKSGDIKDDKTFSDDIKSPENLPSVGKR